jgi:hypothetical protein
MKKSELRQIIKEEIQNILLEQQVKDFVSKYGKVKISESQNEKNYEYFYNRISKGVDKFKQMLRDSGHID